ncbi:DUF5687 family protein [Algoriphagus zhangzhouensis]|uniref:ABC-2 type transport system permease protein n=1 Tax=Algoriphagus zhangzhouensis TaxID=1073327 RepID=A0A1M7ZIP4_9BACT|nr:DUF5687 family protein [Algoriphagus zhangzhouensis]TDY43736.1 hypothetical protein A8938_3836 [Algoriphagus zhangzhouensis]SHO64744.1 hypothetical protein SAMN04488108_3625 [Algoriphagus zhangzhouensis]
MFFELIRLQFLKSIRSTSFAKSLITNIVLGLVILLLLSYVVLAGVFLPRIIQELTGSEDTLSVLNSYLIYFFLFEFMYRYFIQQLPVVDLESLLHLPIGKRKIMHMLLIRSFFSPMSIIALLLFLPSGLQVVLPEYGSLGLLGWIGSIIFTSWILHWFMLWFKQKFEDSTIGLVIVVAVLVLGSGASYMGWYNLGEIMKPVFDFAMTSLIPLIVLAIGLVGSYYLCFSYYLSNAYLEDLSEEENVRFTDQSIGFFSRFGNAGEMANVEWKLIIRHKKSRTYIMLSIFFLLYGLIFYTNPAYQSEDGISPIFIFVGVFITGIFMIQYGQLFLSWNSQNFDYYLMKKGGVEELVKGKYLLFIFISCLSFLASVPYVYFGWEFLIIHFATFIFNIGVLVHAIIYLALWKPKPMDLNKGAMFNYEGVGAAQWLMILPMMGLPYLVYLPFSLLVSDYAGLIALFVCGIIGILSFKVLSRININRVYSNKYEISSSFRQEL